MRATLRERADDHNQLSLQEHLHASAHALVARGMGFRALAALLATRTRLSLLRRDVRLAGGSRCHRAAPTRARFAAGDQFRPPLRAAQRTRRWRAAVAAQAAR